MRTSLEQPELIASKVKRGIPKLVGAEVFSQGAVTVWKWCRALVRPLPRYPQDKEKVERTPMNVSEEFIYLLRKFPSWLKGKIKLYQQWYNEKRFHRGINAIPANLYKR
jgi:hypothetical protein